MARHGCLGFVLSMTMAALLGCPASQAAAVAMWNVTSGADDPSNPVSGTLRYALFHASPGDTIRFTGAGTTVVLADQVTIDRALTIKGPATIRQGATNKRVLEVSAACMMNDITVTGGNFANQGLSALKGAGIFNRSTGNLTMNSCTVTGNTGGGAVENHGTLTMNSCTLTNNTNFLAFGSAVTNVYLGGGLHTNVTLTGCTIENNDVAGSLGGAIYNGDILVMNDTDICNNTTGKGSGLLSRLGGGLYLGCRSNTTLTNGCRVTGNDPSQLYKEVTYFSTPVFTYDSTCVIGDAPNRSATAFAGYAGEAEPEPRSIIGDADVNDVKNALADSGSDLFAAVRQALSSDLGRTPGGTSAMLAPLAGLTASLYYANTFENVTVTSGDLVVEYTASWPENARYYALFCKADGSGYEIPERGVQFEIRAGQTLPDGVTPPDFYVPGEGLMTWRNVVTDGGSYDLNPGVGVVTFRVCSVRAAEATGDKGSGGGCNAGGTAGFGAFALLFGLPLVATGTGIGGRKN
jgi:hypothetical protein